MIDSRFHLLLIEAKDRQKKFKKYSTLTREEHFKLKEEKITYYSDHNFCKETKDMINDVIGDKFIKYSK